MNDDMQALDVYLDAEERFSLGCASRVDEIIVVLWEEVKDQAATIREQALKISYLEMKEQQPANPAGEYTELLSRLSRP